MAPNTLTAAQLDTRIDTDQEARALAIENANLHAQDALLLIDAAVTLDEPAFALYRDDAVDETILCVRACRDAQLYTERLREALAPAPESEDDEDAPHATLD